MIDATRSTHNQEIVNSYVTGYNKGKLDSKFEFIEKACEYLRTHLWQSVDDDNDPIVESVNNITLDSFIKDFRRYMEN